MADPKTPTVATGMLPDWNIGLDADNHLLIENIKTKEVIDLGHQNKSTIKRMSEAVMQMQIFVGHF